MGLDAVMTGIRYNSKDDYEAVEKASTVYDALYTYCRLKLLREKYRTELSGMNRREQRMFLLQMLKKL